MRDDRGNGLLCAAVLSKYRHNRHNRHKMKVGKMKYLYDRNSIFCIMIIVLVFTPLALNLIGTSFVQNNANDTNISDKDCLEDIYVKIIIKIYAGFCDSS